MAWPAASSTPTSSWISATSATCSARCSAAIRSPHAGPASGADAQTDAEITLTEAAFGAKLELDLDLVSVCDRCEGSGAEPGTADLDVSHLRRIR